MKRFNNIKLLSCDIDGTLVGKSRMITENTVRTIEEVMREGYLFGVASGRPVADLKEYCSRWNMNGNFDFIIGFNGCELYDKQTNEIQKFNMLSCQNIKEIIEIMKPFDGNVSMYKPGIYLASKDTDRAWYSAFRNKRKYVVSDNMEQFYDEPNCGIMFRVDPEKMSEIEEMVAGLKDKDYIGFKTQPDLMEFSHKDANKAVALKKYCDNHNISLDECMAFGDTTNDNGMLKCCHGVCMINGSDDTKDCAEIITDIGVEDEGWVNFVKENLL